MRRLLRWVKIWVWAYASLMGLSVSKDRLVEISSWSNLSDPPSPESIPRGDLSFVESSGIGQLISYGSPESARYLCPI